MAHDPPARWLTDDDDDAPSSRGRLLPKPRFAMLSTSMGRLLSCPFCRELFDHSEATECPECDIPLVPLEKLPPSEEAKALEPTPEVQPHMEVLPWGYKGRMRGALVVTALVGLGLFFAPWVHELAPNDRVLTGFDLAQRIKWMWSPAVAFFVMIPLVLSRRSVYLMRGARLAVGMLASLALTTVVVRVLASPQPADPRIVFDFAWMWGLYATGVVAAIALFMATRFGGGLTELPTRRKVRPRDETLH